jgi:hypothetical protein
MAVTQSNNPTGSNDVSDEFMSLVEAVDLSPEQRAELGVTTDGDTVEDEVFGEIDAAVLTDSMREALGGI